MDIEPGIAEIRHQRHLCAVELMYRKREGAPEDGTERLKKFISGKGTRNQIFGESGTGTGINPEGFVKNPRDRYGTKKIDV